MNDKHINNDNNNKPVLDGVDNLQHRPQDLGKNKKGYWKNT